MGLPSFPAITERRHAWGFLVYDPSDGSLSREEITIASGEGVCTVGQVLAHNVGAAVVTAKAGNTGNGTAGTVTLGPSAKDGVYKLTVIEPGANAGAFELEDPDGLPCPTGTVGVAYTGGGLSFTLADGATDFVSGDQLNITIALASTFAVYDPADPGHLAADLAVLGSEYIDATSAAQRCAALTTGPAKVNASELVWGAGVTTDNQKAAALAQLKRQGIRAA